MKRSISSLFLASIFSFSISSFSYADGLPDLVAIVGDISVVRGQTVGSDEVAIGCAKGPTNRTLIRFSTTASNIGTSDLVIGHPDCPDCIGDPAPVCTNQQFVCNVVEHEPEFASYASYELVKKSGRVMARGHKQGFCVEDVSCNDGITPQYSCDNMGVTAGCADTYSSGTRCQYIDVTDVKPGKYLLNVEVNPLRTLQESDFTNNIAQVPVTLCSGSKDLEFKMLAPNKNGRQFSIKTSLTVPASRVSFNPLKEALPISLYADGNYVFSTVIPAGAPGKGCGPFDGWSQSSNGKIWTYTNRTGQSDKTCFGDIGGIQKLQLTKNGTRFDIVIQGIESIYTLNTLPKYVEFTTNLDNSQFSCSFSHSTKCRKAGYRKYAIVCE